jgi:hypothetical protein
MIELRRRTARLAAVATAGVAVMAVAGVAVAGVASGAGTGATRRASTSLVYTCRFPSGAKPVRARIAAAFPATGTVGRAIQPTGVHVTVTVPRAALGDLGGRGTTTFRASVSLGLTMAEGRTSSRAAWRALKARPARLPAGGLVLPAAGPVPPAQSSGPGKVIFTADGLLLVLIPRKAIVPREANGTAASPAALTVACGPRRGQDRQLAVVPVSGASPSPSRRAGTGRHPSVAPSPAATSCFIKSTTGLIGSAFIAGYSNVRKLNEAALLGPGPNNHPRAGTTDLNLLYNIVDSCKQIFYSYNTGQLNYRGKPQLPPARATFLNFGFVPVTATLTITVIPSDCRDVTGHLIGKVGLCIVLKQPFTSSVQFTTVTSEQQFRIYDVTVNGTPLDVGPHCETPVPTKVVLTSNAHYDVTNGGVLSGDVTIPPFTGCGVGENLDPLLNSAIAGPGNFVQLTQAPTCAKVLATGQVNANCRIPPGPGHKYGVPKFYPTPVH